MTLPNRVVCVACLRLPQLTDAPHSTCSVSARHRVGSVRSLSPCTSGRVHRRTFTQTVLPGALVLGSPAKDRQSAGGEAAPSTQRDKAVADNKLVRTDARARTMDAFVSRRSFGDREKDPARAAAAAVAAAGIPHTSHVAVQ